MLTETDKNEHRERLKHGLYEMLCHCPAQAFITLTLANEIRDVGLVTSKLIRWMNYQKQRALKSDLAFLGLLTDKDGRAHIHGFMWGENNKGLSLTRNPRFSLHDLSRKTKHWGGFILASDFREASQEHRAGYIAYSNYSDGLYEPLFYTTNKKLRLFQEVSNHETQEAQSDYQGNSHIQRHHPVPSRF